MKKYITAIIGVFVLMYMMMSFYTLTFNFTEWSSAERFTYLFFSFFYSLILTLYLKSIKK